MHCEVLLNPFYYAQYVTEDDGQDYTVFTQLQEEDDKQKLSNKNELDAVEDLILDDFSLGDDDSNSEGSGSVASVGDIMDEISPHPRSESVTSAMSNQSNS